MPRILVTLSDNYSFVSEQFRTIRTNITFSMSIDDQKTLLITSSIPGEGKQQMLPILPSCLPKKEKSIVNRRRYA